MDVPSSGAEARRHAWRNLIAHLSEAGETERLFELLEQRGFLANQADFFGDFGRTGEAVESFVLPATIAAADWNRFLRYAAIAFNLRGLAEDLAEPEILQALAQGDRRKLALVLAIVGLTAVLPLGGLALPFWIWARQKLWPRYAISPLAR